MSYAASAALQRAIFETLRDDSTLQGLTGAAIFDALPPGPRPATYVTLGAETVKGTGDVTGSGAVHDLVVSVVTDAAGFQTAKEIAGAVSDALDGAPLTLARGCLVSLAFLRAVAKRDGDGLMRRIDMTFRARVENT